MIKMNDQILDETIALLQELIQNECVNPPGNEMKSIITIKNFLEKKGIECKIFESESVWSATIIINRACLLKSS